MKIHINTEVFCGDISCGHVSCVIYDADKDEITHFVVKEKHFPLPPNEYLVPVKNIIEANSEKVKLDISAEELSRMENFIEQEFVPSNSVIRGYGSEQLRTPVVLLKEVDREKIPSGELAIHHGVGVFAKNEQIGKVDDILIKSKEDFTVTHIENCTPFFRQVA